MEPRPAAPTVPQICVVRDGAVRLGQAPRRRRRVAGHHLWQRNRPRRTVARAQRVPRAAARQRAIRFPPFFGAAALSLYSV